MNIKINAINLAFQNFCKENITIDPGIYIANEYEKMISYER